MNIGDQPTSPSVSPPDEPGHYEECPCHEDRARWDDDTFDCACECAEIDEEARAEKNERRREYRLEEGE